MYIRLWDKLEREFSSTLPTTSLWKVMHTHSQIGDVNELCRWVSPSDTVQLLPLFPDTSAVTITYYYFCIKLLIPL